MRKIRKDGAHPKNTKGVFRLWRKNHKMKTQKFTGRIALLTMAILLLLTTLVGCFAKTEAPKLEYVESKLYENLDQHGLSSEEMKKVADIFSAAYGAKEAFDAREALVAANRGYDMTASDFDDSNADNFKEDKGLNLDAAKNVIRKANTVAATTNTVTTYADSELYKEDGTGILDKLNATDVTCLLSAFREEIKIDETKFLDGVLGVIGKVLNGITKWLGFGNYIIGICLFAIVIEILMLPFSIMQQKNSIKQASLRPKEMAIKNKYKGRNDQPTMQKMQSEIQELYQRENYSPYSGCLPLIVQMPVIIALYNIVMDPLHYVLGVSKSVTAAITTFATASPAAGGLGESLKSTRGTIELLSRLKNGSGAIIDAFENFQYYTFSDGVISSLEEKIKVIPNFNIGRLSFGDTPDFANLSNGSWILLLVPVLTFVTYFFSSKLNRKFMYQPATNDGIDAKQAACSNTMMDVTMPAMSAFFTMAVPAVIGIYWGFRSWVGLLKSFILSRIMPLPKFTEEDYKAAEREMAGKAPKKANKNQSSSNAVKAVRSLHYIDDEDFEDTRERGLARKAALEEKEKQEKAEAAERAQKLPFGKISLKKDDRKSEQKEEAPAQEEQADDTTNNE